MKAPPRLQALIDEGLIDEVLRPLTSGKEATVYVVRCGSESCCAKVYKEATQRSFRHAVAYTENRSLKNSREGRAMAKRTRFGRQIAESQWQSTEIDALQRLADAGVRVPQPRRFHDGVLLMDLVTDAQGNAAPRLHDLRFAPEAARRHHDALLREVVRMLCAGIVHGDLSEFNVLLGADGPVVIDLPQAVDAAGNRQAERMLLRDVANLRRFFGQFAPALHDTRYGEEIWQHYERGTLRPSTELHGQAWNAAAPVDMRGLLRAIGEARAEEERQRGGRQ